MANPDGISIDRPTQVAPLIRGLLADPSQNDDLPYNHIILKTLAGQEALDFAAAPDKREQSYPTALQPLAKPPLYLEIQGRYTSISALRENVARQIEEHVTRYGQKPQIICLPALGILYVERVVSTAGDLLHNKVTLITGAAGAIGHGICRELLSKGSYVAVTDLPGERLDHFVREFARTTEERIIGVPLDVTDRNSVAQGFAQVIDTWGGVDIVIVNAGIAMISSLTEMDLADFQRVERVNVEGTLLTIAEAGRVLTLQGIGGDIVLISTKSVFSPAAKYGAYAATKAASHQLGRVASLELAEFGIRVNMVAPVGVFADQGHKSQLWEEIGVERMRALGQTAADLETYYRNRNLLKAKITAQHVANAVMFFVTHQTPTTGATIPVDGGLPDATPR